MQQLGPNSLTARQELGKETQAFYKISFMVSGKCISNQVYDFILQVIENLK